MAPLDVQALQGKMFAPQVIIGMRFYLFWLEENGDQCRRSTAGDEPRWQGWAMLGD